MLCNLTSCDEWADGVDLIETKTLSFGATGNRLSKWTAGNENEAILSFNYSLAVSEALNVS